MKTKEEIKALLEGQNIKEVLFDDEGNLSWITLESGTELLCKRFHPPAVLTKEDMKVEVKVDEEETPASIVHLRQIVADFNRAFDRWTHDWKCRVTFGWLYGDGMEKQVKAMEILGVDKIVWRKPPPKSLAQIMVDGGKNEADKRNSGNN